MNFQTHQTLHKWGELLKDELVKPYVSELSTFLDQERSSFQILPKEGRIFRALELVAPEDVRVVILGQDPYIRENQANGLAFSVNEGVALPPSLRNVFEELDQDVDVCNKSGDLSKWARQGVLLLNSVLTVRSGYSGSHAHKGWEEITGKIVETVARRNSAVIFLLWGNYAKQKASLLRDLNCAVLEAAHPSPFSANSGFFGCRHFSKTNALLRRLGLPKIDWRT